MINAGAIMDSLAKSSFPVDTTRMYPILPSDTLQCNGSPKQCFATNRAAVHWGEDIVAFSAANLDSALEAGQGYVFHVAHSDRHFLGCLSTVMVEQRTADPCDCVGDMDWHNDCRNALKAANPGWNEKLTKEIVDDLNNGPEYSVVVSRGSYTNMFDLDAVSEHFMRNPNGGAAAYFGKVTTFGGYAGEPAIYFFDNVFNEDVIEVGMAVALATNATYWPLPAGTSWRLLGDPEMPLWTKAPGELEVTCTPSTFSNYGAQTITVDVEDNASSEAVEGARVCLKQTELGYAVAWTDSDGSAVFPAFTPMSDDSIAVVATARNYEPKQTKIKLAYAGGEDYIAYQGPAQEQSAFIGANSPI
jgi:hypothetical protein